MLSLKGTIKEYGVLSEMVYKENPIDYLTSGLLTDSYQLLKSQKKLFNWILFGIVKKYKYRRICFGI